MRELEADLQAPLMVRSASGVAFTEFGRALVAHARVVLGQLQRAQAGIEALRGAAAGKLSIGVTPWVALTFLPPTVQRFRQRMPEVQLEFFEGLLAVVQPRLRDGSLDFSIGRPPAARRNRSFTTCRCSPRIRPSSRGAIIRKPVAARCSNWKTRSGC